MCIYGIICLKIILLITGKILHLICTKTTFMLQPNLLICALAALVPLALGFVWYNPKTFGNAWMKSAGMNEESMKGANMAVIFGLTYVFSFLIAISLTMMTIHQFGLQSLLIEEKANPIPGSMERLTELMGIYGSSFRTFHHGVIHGIIAALFFVVPIMNINALFERKNWKYMLINGGYWIVCCAIMGGIVCQFT